MRNSILGFTLVGLALLQTGAVAVAGPDPKDVESIEGILAAVYDVISGPAGQARDWDRFRGLFIPEARLIPALSPPGGATASYRVMTPEDYVKQAGPVLEKNGFFESELHRKVERFGSVAHVFSTYESRRKSEDPQPFARGINSFQLFHDGSRWWIVTIFWASERESLTIPPQYLP